MPADASLQILLDHHHWANGQLLDACAVLSEEQLHRRFDIGPGSLHDTLRHMATALGRWDDALNGRPMRPHDTARRTLPELRTLLENAHTALAAAIPVLPLDADVPFTRNGITYHFTRALVFAHILTHGMHHRAQCLNMLRHLGLSPVPPSSVVEWSFLTHPPTPPQPA